MGERSPGLAMRLLLSCGLLQLFSLSFKLNILRIHSVNDADQAKMIVGGESGG